jgi:hypothetical protein
MKVTWLGEDALHEPQAGPSVTTWAGLRFPKGEAVSVTDPVLIKKARNNQFFSVEDGEDQKRGPGRPPKVKADGDKDAS